MTLIAPGTCRHCGCTDADGCRLANGDTCSWIDHDRIVCSNPSCVRAEQARKAAARAARPVSPYRNMGFGAICDLKRKLARRARRKGRAA